MNTAALFEKGRIASGSAVLQMLVIEQAMFVGIDVDDNKVFVAKTLIFLIFVVLVVFQSCEECVFYAGGQKTAKNLRHNKFWS